MRRFGYLDRKGRKKNERIRQKGKKLILDHCFILNTKSILDVLKMKCEIQNEIMFKEYIEEQHLCDFRV